MTIRAKLVVASLLVVTVIVLMAFALSRIGAAIHYEFGVLTERTMRVTNELEQARAVALQMRAKTSDYLLAMSQRNEDDASQERGLVEAQGEELRELETTVVSFGKIVGRYGDLVQRYFPDEENYRKAIQQSGTEYIRAYRHFVEMANSDAGFAELVHLKAEIEVLEGRLLDLVDGAYADELLEFDEKTKLVRDIIRRNNTGIWFGLIAIAAFITTVSYVVGTSVSDRIGKLAQALSRVQSGDLSVRLKITGNDEVRRLADSFDNMTGELRANERLQGKLVEQLEMRNAELERFAYTVSHDLKSPLITIRGFAELLQADSRDSENDQLLAGVEYIVAATETMGQLLDDLLDLSRIGRVVNDPESFSMTELAGETVRNLDGMIRRHAASIRIQDDMPAAYGDRGRIGEVLQNLVENAIKFSREGHEPKIEILARQEQDRVVFLVRDEGIGIEPHHYDAVFGLFERLDTQAGGTGIGLALVKRIVEMHGGQIWIEAIPDRAGTSFCFTLG